LGEGRRRPLDPATSPVNLVREDAPPFLIALVTALRSVSASPVVYVELPGGHHAFDLFRSFRFEVLIDGIEVFVARVKEGKR
jgi:hypothetical protein